MSSGDAPCIPDWRDRRADKVSFPNVIPDGPQGRSEAGVRGSAILEKVPALRPLRGLGRDDGEDQ